MLRSRMTKKLQGEIGTFAEVRTLYDVNAHTGKITLDSREHLEWLNDQAISEVLEELLKTGHGGGNWRRIIELQQAKHPRRDSL